MALKSQSTVSQSESPLNGNGWVFLQDLQYTSASPLIIPAGQRMKIPNNALGLLTLKKYAPVSASNWYDENQSIFHCDNVGDFFLYRLNLTVEASVNNRNVTVDFDIGTANTPYETTQVLARGAGIPVKMSLTIPIPASQGFKTNGGTINITGECDLKVYRISIVIHKTFKGPLV